MGGASRHAEETDGARVAFGVLKDALADRRTPPEAEREAARLLGCLARQVTLCRSDLPNALFAADLEAALTRALGDPEVADACGQIRAALIAASLLAALDDKWAFQLRTEWLKQAADFR